MVFLNFINENTSGKKVFIINNSLPILNHSVIKIVNNNINNQYYMILNTIEDKLLTFMNENLNSNIIKECKRIIRYIKINNDVYSK